MLQNMPVHPLWGDLKRRAVRLIEEHAYPVRRADGRIVCWCTPCGAALRGARCAIEKSTRIQYAVLRVPQYMPVRPLWGGFKRRAVRLIEEHAYPVRRADAASYAGAPLVGRLEEARGAP